VRAIISLCFLLMALSSAAAGIAGKELPYVAMFFLLFGAFAASGLDGVGGIPFLRAVRTRERQRMACRGFGSGESDPCRCASKHRLRQPAHDHNLLRGSYH
jgi:hypothetical protein